MAIYWVEGAMYEMGAWTYAALYIGAISLAYALEQGYAWLHQAPPCTSGGKEDGPVCEA